MPKQVAVISPTIQDFIKIPFIVYSAVGIKLFQWTPDDKMTLREKISIVFVLLNAVVNFLAMAGYFLFEEFENSLVLAALIIYIVFAGNSIFKMLSVWIGRHTLRTIFLDMNKTFPRTEQERREYQVREYYASINRYQKFVIIFHAAAVVMFTMFPIAQSTLEILTNQRNQIIDDNDDDDDDAAVVGFIYRFPYIMTYPFNEHRPFPFVFVYFTQFIAGITCSSFFLGSDLLLLVTVHLVNIQFEYLIHRIERFSSKNFTADMQEITEVLKFHNRTLDFSERINNVFKISILLNYMSTSTCLCLVGFQLLAGSNILDLSKFITFLVSAILHIYYICAFGQRLMDLSEGLSDAFAGHSWYDAHIKYQHMLPIAIIRAQRPAYLSAYKFFQISMESFANLMGTTYRVFTLIKTRYEESGKN